MLEPIFHIPYWELKEFFKSIYLIRILNEIGYGI